MRFLRMAPLFLLLVACPALAEDSPPDSTSRVPILQIFLQNGQVIQAQRVMLNSLGMVIVRMVNGADSTIAANDVRSIMDEGGMDRTKHVLGDSRVLRVGDAAEAKQKRKKYEMPAHEKGTYLGVHAGAAWPAADFGDVAGTGFEIDVSAHWRRGKRTILGARLDYSEFGGKGEVENFLSEGTGGAVDQVTFRSLGASFYARWLIFRQPRFDPFLFLSLGGGVFRTGLSGPGASGSDAKYALHEQYGLGVHWKTSERTGVELLASTGALSTGDLQASAGNADFHSDGAHGHLLLKVGFVRRYGGGD